MEYFYFNAESYSCCFKMNRDILFLCIGLCIEYEKSISNSHDYRLSSRLITVFCVDHLRIER